MGKYKGFDKVKAVFGDKITEMTVIPFAKRFYGQIRKKCLRKKDIEGVKYCDIILKAINEKDEPTLTEYQAILGAHLQMQKQGGR